MRNKLKVTLKYILIIFMMIVVSISVLLGESKVKSYIQDENNLPHTLAQQDVLGNGSLEIEAIDCDIFINDHFVGKENFQKNYPPGIYKIIAYKDKYHYAAEEVVNLQTGEIKKIELVPESIKGILSVVTKPLEVEGAYIYINEILRKEKTPSNIALTIGTYTISVKHPDYLPVKHDNITIFENVMIREQFNMTPYKGSLKQKEDFWKRQKVIALSITFIIGVVGGGGGQYMGWEKYFDYLNAGNENEAVTLRSVSDNYFQARDISYGISISALIYAGFSYIQEIIYNKMQK